MKKFLFFLMIHFIMYIYTGDVTGSREMDQLEESWLGIGAPNFDLLGAVVARLGHDFQVNGLSLPRDEENLNLEECIVIQHPCRRLGAYKTFKNFFKYTRRRHPCYSKGVERGTCKNYVVGNYTVDTDRVSFLCPACGAQVEEIFDKFDKSDEFAKCALRRVIGHLGSCQNRGRTRGGCWLVA